MLTPNEYLPTRLQSFLYVAVGCVVSLVACSDGSTEIGSSDELSPGAIDFTRNATGTVHAPPGSAAETMINKEWRELMAKTPSGSVGCHVVHYPDVTWSEVPCMDRPVRQGYHPSPRSSRALKIVGNRTYVAYGTPAGTSLEQATGSFRSVTGLTSESDTTVPGNPGIGGGPNHFTLQLNTNKFSTPQCAGISGCMGWLQFVFDSTDAAGAYFTMENVLVGWGPTCPFGWSTDGHNNCYDEFVWGAGFIGTVAALQNWSLTGFITSTSDTVMISDGTSSWSVSQPDSVLNAFGNWNSFDFNVFGEGGGTRAVFNSGTTITVQMQAFDQALNPVPATCLLPGSSFDGSDTGETNNLNFVGSCCPIAALGGGYALEFTEGDPGTPQPFFCPALGPATNGL